MCSESLWWRCHRRLLADFVAVARGVEVRHLMHDGRTESHRPSPGLRLRDDGLLVYDAGQADAALTLDEAAQNSKSHRQSRYHNDMDTYSLVAAARTLGTSAPRVRRAIDRLGMRVERTDSGVFRLTQGQVDELASILGITAPVPDLSRTEARVLAALSRSPRGVASVREAARRAGTSPTAAGAPSPDLTTLAL